MSKAISLGDYFSQIVFMSNLKAGDVKNTILKRHQITGYQLKFQSSEEIRESRSFKKLASAAEQQTYLQGLFFEQLQNIAKGNVSVAILFWLRSIESVEDHILNLAPQSEFQASFIHQLSQTDVFTLGALVQHDSLNEEEHSRIFRNEIQRSQKFLSSLANKGVLLKTEKGYKIHPFLYRTVVQALRRKNILH